MAHASLLRASSQQASQEVDLRVVQGAADDPDGGVAHGALLRRLTTAILSEHDALDAVRAEAVAVLGERRTVHACQVVAAFDGINRVADTAGIETDAAMAVPAAQTIETLGLTR